MQSRQHRVVSPFSKTRGSMVLERQPRYRTFQTPPLRRPFCLAAPTCPTAPVPCLQPWLLTWRQCTTHPTRLFSGIRNAVDKILRAAICRPATTPCKWRSARFRSNSSSTSSLIREGEDVCIAVLVVHGLRGSTGWWRILGPRTWNTWDMFRYISVEYYGRNVILF